jgi:hypothetical protein
VSGPVIAVPVAGRRRRREGRPWGVRGVGKVASGSAALLGGRRDAGTLLLSPPGEAAIGYEPDETNESRPERKADGVSDTRVSGCWLAA